MAEHAKPAQSVWRVGRKVGRTIYAQLDGHTPSDSDPVIGMMNTPELARRVVDAINENGRVDLREHFCVEEHDEPRPATTMLHEEDDPLIWVPVCDECAEHAV